MADNVMQLNINLTKVDTKSTEQEQLDTVTATAKNGNSGIDKKDVLKKAAGVTMAYNQIQKITTTVVTTKLSQIGSVYGDQAKQNEINNVMSSVGTVSGIGQSIIGGALVAGPVGAVVMGLTSLIAEGYAMFERNASYQRLERENAINSMRSSEALGMTAIDRNRK